MFALIHDDKVVEVADATFETHSDLTWIDCSDDVKAGWSYSGGVFAAPIMPVVAPVAPVTLDDLRAQLAVIAAEIAKLS